MTGRICELSCITTVTDAGSVNFSMPFTVASNSGQLMIDYSIRLISVRHMAATGTLLTGICGYCSATTAIIPTTAFQSEVPSLSGPFHLASTTYFTFGALEELSD